MITDLGWRLELHAPSSLGRGHLLAVAYKRSREGDWMVATRTERTPRSVPDKTAAREALEEYEARVSP